MSYRKIIYADDAIDAIYKCTDIYVGNLPIMVDKSDAYKALEALPSAQPEQRWIPCSKRLPENRRYVLVTYQHEYGLIDHGITWYGEAEKKWDTSRNVIAWMPLPEPYAERR